MTKKSRPFDSAAGTASEQQFTGNSAASQRARVLRYLRAHRSMSTFEARHHIDCCHPAARVMELRKLGNNIQTFWSYEVNPEGHSHRVARYVLMPEAAQLDADSSRRINEAEECE